MSSLRQRAAALAAAAAVALAVLAPPAAAAVPDPLRLRPPGCDPKSCAGCVEYSLHADNITDAETGEIAADPCGSDGVYFPVISWYFANCAKWYPRAWKCVPCCSAGCASGACQWEGPGAINVTAGCSACPEGTKEQMLEQYAETCRSCFQSHFCRDEVPTKWRVCEGKPTDGASPSPSPPAETKPIIRPSPKPSPPPSPAASPGKPASPAEPPAEPPAAEQQPAQPGGTPSPAPAPQQQPQQPAASPAAAPSPVPQQGAGGTTNSSAAPPPSAARRSCSSAGVFAAVLLWAAAAGLSS